MYKIILCINLRIRLLFTLPLSLILLNAMIQNLINNTDLPRLLSTHEVVTLHKLLNILQRHLLRPVQMTEIDIVQLRPYSEDLFRVDRDIGSLAEVSTRRLVDHDRGMGETEAFTGVAAGKEEGAH